MQRWNWRMGVGVWMVVLAWAAVGGAAPVTKTLEYASGEVVLEGYLALPEAVTAPAPAVLIVHQWMGITEHEREVARRLAAEGYIALACDIYGKGDRPADRSAAGGYAGKYKGNIPLFRERLRAGLEALRAVPEVDGGRVAVIGYCFGGTGALELGRDGADVKAIVSIHGALATPNPEDAKQIRGTVLVCHGGADPHVPDAELLDFMNAMRATAVDWYLMTFGHAVHGFSHRHDPEVYNAKAEERTWKAMLDLFGATLGGAGGR